jgi:hypothetical protein
MGHVNNMYIDLHSIHPIREGAFVGHTFDLVIELVDAANCQLRWYEKTDEPYVDSMMRQIWNNMTIIGEASPVFAPWFEAVESANQGAQTIRLTDPPAIIVPASGERDRWLDFRIIVEGDDGSERVVQARQVICVVNHVPVKWSFVILTNNAETHPAGFVDPQPYPDLGKDGKVEYGPNAPKHIDSAWLKNWKYTTGNPNQGT